MEHGRQESFQDVAARGDEALGGGEGDLDRPGLRVASITSSPRVAAAGGSGALPSTASQNGRVRWALRVVRELVLPISPPSRWSLVSVYAAACRAAWA